MNETVTVRVENRSTCAFTISPEQLERTIAASGIRDALESVSVLATFHDFDYSRGNDRSGSASLLNSRGDTVLVRVKVFVRDNDLESANHAFAHEMRHAAQYALYGMWVALMDGEDMEQDACEFADALGAQVVA